MKFVGSIDISGLRRCRTLVRYDVAMCHVLDCVPRERNVHSSGAQRTSLLGREREDLARQSLAAAARAGTGQVVMEHTMPGSMV